MSELRETWESHALRLFGHSEDLQNCPAALEVLDVARWGVCLFLQAPTEENVIRCVGCLADLPQRDFYHGVAGDGFDKLHCAQECLNYNYTYFAMQGTLGDQCFCVDTSGTRLEVELHVNDSECEIAGCRNAVYKLDRENTPTLHTHTHSAIPPRGMRLAELCKELKVNFGQHVLMKPPWPVAPQEQLNVFFNSRYALPLCSMAPALQNQADLHTWRGKASSYNLFHCSHNWDAYRTASAGYKGATRSFTWSLNIVQNSRLPEEFTNESCSLGVLTLLLDKIYLAMSYNTVAVDSLVRSLMSALKQFNLQFEGNLERVSKDSFSAVMSSDWPVLATLCRVVSSTQYVNPSGIFGIQRKPYDLDFYPHELLQPLFNHSVSHLRSMAREEHLAMLRSAKKTASGTYQAVLSALEVSLALEAASSVRKMVVANVLWGDRYSSYLKGFLERSVGLGLGSLTFI